jgi:hypothetical protein
MKSTVKDVDFIILSKLDDESLLNVCKTNKYAASLCNDELFWKRRFHTKYSEFQDISPNLAKMSWKNFYLAIVYYDNKYTDKENLLKDLAASNYTELTIFFVKLYKEITKQFILDYLLTVASMNNNQELIKFFLHLGSDPKAGVRGAIIKGNLDLLKYFVSLLKIPINWHMEMIIAATRHHTQLFQYLLERGATVNDGLMGAASGGHNDLIDYFISLGADDFDMALTSAVQRGKLDSVKYLMTMRINDYHFAMQAAIMNYNVDLVKLFAYEVDDFRGYIQDAEEIRGDLIEDGNEENIKKLDKIITILKGQLWLHQPK